MIVPVFNEAGTLERVLTSLARLGPRVEIVATDDGSTDRSREVLADFRRRHPRLPLRVLRHSRNRGKGRAVRTALEAARGRLVVVQDADLETDPKDIRLLLRAARRFPACAVFGSRFSRPLPRRPPLATGAANTLITWTANALFGSRLTDVACAYKMLPARLLRSLDLKAERFEIEAEITAGLLARGKPVLEIPVRYRPRRYSEGKKIHPLDGLRILLTLLKLRLHRTRHARA